MSLDSLLASINSGVTQVTGVQPSKHKGLPVTPSNSPEVTQVTIVTPVTPQETAGVTPKPRQDGVCTLVTPVTPEKTSAETAREFLADILKETGDEADLAEVLDWYAGDLDDIAHLPREQVVYMVRDYFLNHERYRPELWSRATVKCGDCKHWREYRPHLGHCDKGHREAIAGNWGTTPRVCDDYHE